MKYGLTSFSKFLFFFIVLVVVVLFLKTDISGAIFEEEGDFFIQVNEEESYRLLNKNFEVGIFVRVEGFIFKDKFFVLKLEVLT